MRKPYFADYGAHVLVDGQFGSTGKGLFAAYLAEKAIEQGLTFDGVISNAGPNSGHTFYFDGEKHVLKQLPSFAVFSALAGVPILVHLSAGAIINPAILRQEAELYPNLGIVVHPNAAVIQPVDIEAEKGGSIAAVAGTRSGTGHALARKVFREPNAVWGNSGHWDYEMPGNVSTSAFSGLNLNNRRYFVEVSQGFSLGINSQFYPKVTSRECTVMQAIADARIAPKFVTRTYMVARTYPIRVGNVDGHSSGDHYSDQQETSWKELGVAAERTTVTNRVRRVFTFSKMQMIEALMANQPDFVLMNFMNYMEKSEDRQKLYTDLHHMKQLTGCYFELLTGWGPHNNDIVPF